MTNLTIPQCLEKLAVLDAKLAKKSEVEPYIWVNINGSWYPALTENPSVGNWYIFGAACERVESIPSHQIELRDLGPFWKVVIWVSEGGEKSPKFIKLSFKDKEGSPAHAALNAYVALLESQPKECPECENLQHGIKDEYKCKACGGSGYENPILSESNIPCQDCSGTGVESDPIKGTELAVNRHCAACSGTGKKLEAKK